MQLFAVFFENAGQTLENGTQKWYSEPVLSQESACRTPRRASRKVCVFAVFCRFTTAALYIKECYFMRQKEVILAVAENVPSIVRTMSTQLSIRNENPSEHRGR